MKNHKLLLIFSLLLNFFFVSIFGYRKIKLYSSTIFQRPSKVIKPPINDSIINYNYNKYKINEAKIAIYDSFTGTNQDILFFGDSLTEGFPLQETFNDLNIKNRGISGNTTVDLLKRTDITIKYHPKKIFIMIGINDIYKLPMKITFYNIKCIINKIIKQSPKTKIYIQSILPISDSTKIFTIKKYNNYLELCCKENNMQYINIFPSMLMGNKLNPILTTDGVHLKIGGYKIWAKILKSYIN